MNPSGTCARCGARLAQTAGGGFCPACVLRSVLEPAEVGLPAAKNASGLPRTFGAFELLDEIGRGGMGVVYRARQPALGRTVAVKLLLSGAYASEAALCRFHAEAAAAAGLRHPGIVAIHEYGEHDGQPYYTMDVVPGGNLAQHLAGKPLPARVAAALLVAIADAVQHAHEHGIIHRDLKPSNVLLEESQHPRVSDFGLARRIDDDAGLTLSGQMLGSPNYAAPEQAAGRAADVGVTTDIYGLGALLYHVVTGRAPFNAATAAETLRLVLDSDPPPPRLLNPALPRDVETICLKCLNREPARRYASAREFADDLGRFLREEPIRARPPHLAYRARKFARRHRVLVLAAAAIAMAVGVGAGAAWNGYRRARIERRVAQSARAQAENLVGFIMRDFQPGLAPYGELAVLRISAEDADRYFAGLSPDLRNESTDRAHASVLETLADICGVPPNSDVPYPVDLAAGERAARAALALRRQLALRHPDDPEAAVAAIEDEARVNLNDANRTMAGSDAQQRDLIDRLRSLERRFPDRPVVARALAAMLEARAWVAALQFNRPDEALATATEARTRWEQIVAREPGDKLACAEYAKTLAGLAVAHSVAGRHGDAVQITEQAIAFADATLKTDLENVLLRSLAAQMQHQLAFRVAPLSHRRAAEAERTARESFRALVEREPENPRWRYNYATAHMMETYYLCYDGQYTRGGALLRSWRAQCDLLPDDRNNREQQVRISLLSAELAAGADRLDEARTALQEAERRIESCVAGFPAATAERRRAQLDWEHELARVLAAMRDWPELAQRARTLGAWVDESFRDEPGNGEWLVRRADAQAWLGLAGLRQGNLAEALPMLEAAAAGFRDAPAGFTFNSDRALFAADASEYLAEARIATGDSASAQTLLESVLAFRESCLDRETEQWRWRRRFAHTAFLVADVLPAAESNRRRTLLARAATMLAGNEADERMNAADRELRSKIAAVRAAALTVE